MLEGKRIVVTGSGRGLGRAIALAAARAGAVVGLNYYRDEEPVRRLQAEIEEGGGRGRRLRFDVREETAVERALADFGEKEGKLDGLVNNAGVFVPGLLPALSVADCRLQLETNLLGPIICARAALPALLAGGGGVILNVGSVAARRPNRGQAVYAATKCGLEGLTRALAVEYARKGLRALCLTPGPLDTSMLAGTRRLAEKELLGRVPLGRLGRPEEAAALAVFLLSDQAGYITGSRCAIDGGYLLG